MNNKSMICFVCGTQHRSRIGTGSRHLVWHACATGRALPPQEDR